MLHIIIIRSYEAYRIRIACSYSLFSNSIWIILLSLLVQMIRSMYISSGTCGCLGSIISLNELNRCTYSLRLFALRGLHTGASAVSMQSCLCEIFKMDRSTVDGIK